MHTFSKQRENARHARHVARVKAAKAAKRHSRKTQRTKFFESWIQAIFLMVAGTVWTIFSDSARNTCQLITGTINSRIIAPIKQSKITTQTTTQPKPNTNLKHKQTGKPNKNKQPKTSPSWFSEALILIKSTRETATGSAYISCKWNLSRVLNPATLISHFIFSTMRHASSRPATTCKNSIKSHCHPWGKTSSQ